MINIIKKMILLLNSKQKIRIVIIGILMVIGALLETIGVSLILPLTSAITEPDIITNNKYVRKICQIFDLHSAKTFIILMVIALIFIYIFKNLFLLFEYYVQYRFVYNNRFNTQKNLVRIYLDKSYEFFLSINTSEIIRIISNDVTNAFALLTNILSFFTELIISIMIIILLFFTDPLMCICIGIIFGAITVMIAYIVKPILKRAGISFQKNSAISYKWLLQSIEGIKVIKVSGKEDFFLDQYANFGKKSVDAEKSNNLFNQIPRLFIESVSICGMLAIIAVLLFNGREINTMLPQITAFAFAAVRLMPSVNRMSAAYNSFSYYEPALDKLLETMDEIQNKGVKEKTEKVDKQTDTVLNYDQLKFHEKISLEKITYSYPNFPTPIFESADLDIHKGQSIGIIGASGAGKTTLVDILLGLLKVNGGKILIDNLDINTEGQSWHKIISYIPQTIYMLDDTIKANVAFGIAKKEISEDKIWKSLEDAKLNEFVKTLPDALNTEIGERGIRLSGGQKQRVGIARALYTDPEILILDEATSALDNETEEAIMESINTLRGKKTMIIIAHRLTTIKNCDKIYKVMDKKIKPISDPNYK